MFFVGVLTAFVACGIDISVEELAKLKYGLLRRITDDAIRGMQYFQYFNGFRLGIDRISSRPFYILVSG